MVRTISDDLLYNFDSGFIFLRIILHNFDNIGIVPEDDKLEENEVRLFYFFGSKKSELGKIETYLIIVLPEFKIFGENAKLLVKLGDLVDLTFF